MKIFSEKTGEVYKNVKECLAAEKKYDEEKALEKTKKEELAAARKERAKEIEDALNNVREAENKYYELLNAFLKDYGSYHYTTTTTDRAPYRSLFSLFKPFEDWFW